MPEVVKSTFDTIMSSLEGVESGADGGEAGGNGSDEGAADEGVNEDTDTGNDKEEADGDAEEEADDDASGPGDRNDPDEEAGEEEDEEVTPEQTPEEKAVADAAAAAKGQDEFDKLLDEYGFRSPKAGQKENRIPQSRVRARVKTALKKHAAKFETERTTLQGQVTQSAARIADADTVENLINEGSKSVESARKYVEILAKVHPVFAELLKGGGGGDAPSEAITKLGAMPKPDVDYGDGSFGYSDAQMTKRDQWLMDKAGIQAREALKSEFDSRMTPIEQERKAREQERKDAPVIEARLQALRKTWGSHFIEDEKKGAAGSEILKYQREHKVAFPDAVAAVLLPKLIADRTKMRQEILTELKAKKRKAGKVVSQSSTAGRKTIDDDAPKTTFGTIMDSLDKAGL